MEDWHQIIYCGRREGESEIEMDPLGYFLICDLPHIDKGLKNKQ